MRKQLASMLKTTSSRSRPWQIAFGVTLGVLCGCAVKSPVVALCCAAAAFWLPLHMLAFALATGTSALAVILLAPSIGQLGQWSLQHPAMIGSWTQLESLPLVPWLGLHNTLVNGGMIVGLIASLPIAIASFLVASWILKSDLPAASAEQRAAELAKIATDFSAAEEDSFVELTSADLQLIESLEAEENEEQSATAIGEQQRRIDIAAMGVPRPNFPVHNFEIAETSHEHESPAKSELDSKPTAKPAKVPNPYAFDAVERLEELLSGCRVQPHWADENADTAAVDANSVDAGSADDRLPHNELSDAEDDIESVPTSDEVLHRSHEIAGLVDELIASLDDIESDRTNQQTTAKETVESNVDAGSDTTASPKTLVDTAEKRFDPPHTITNIHTSGQQEPDEPAEVQSEEDIESTVRTVQAELQLRFDQIDMSEQFSKPLYQPHTPSKPGDMQVAKRDSAEEHSRSIGKTSIDDDSDTVSAELEARIERLKTTAPGAAEQDKAAPATGQADTSNESLIHVVQRGHDEALRHLLHHLREIEERVRE